MRGEFCDVSHKKAVSLLRVESLEEALLDGDGVAVGEAVERRERNGSVEMGVWKRKCGKGSVEKGVWMVKCLVNISRKNGRVFS